MKLHLRSILSDEQGATASEYVLLLSLLALGILTGAAALGLSLGDYYANTTQIIRTALKLP